MNGEIYQLTPKQFQSLHNCSSTELEAAELSAEILVGMYDGQPLCFMGFAPITILSDIAYVWMIVTEVGEEHSLLLARHSKKCLARILEKYSCIFGHCFSEDSAIWLKYLGAKFISATEFEIRRG